MEAFPDEYRSLQGDIKLSPIMHEDGVNRLSDRTNAATAVPVCTRRTVIYQRKTPTMVPILMEQTDLQLSDKSSCGKLLRRISSQCLKGDGPCPV
ncbi:unnamed protein product [Ceratitis capitata]|uniref:(Mediterranean fruit fly) hypothetical protein n=1 Tax=Ceratitis capitata TaxID=7213 RepID=A0A811UUP6_CERCA|nr:unnamed protein product [Ceratitis capitata]